MRGYVVGLWVALVFTAYVAGMAVAVAFFDTSPAPCVPVSAVDYDGRADAWFDGSGRVVAMASEEDQLEWCAR